MENSLLVSLSHQGVLRRRLDVIAHNIANMNSAGFKAQRVLLDDHVVTSAGGETRRGEDLAFVRDIASVRDLSEGKLESTGNDSDLALRGEGWFAVETDAGERYTRNGRFRVDQEGRLVTAEGFPVLGDNNAPIVLAEEDARITVSADGVISAASGEVGKLRVVRFEDPYALESVAGGLMDAASPPVDVAEPTVVQGMVEGSNVDPIGEITRMIEVQRAYASAAKLIDREDKRIRTMVEEYAR